MVQIERQSGVIFGLLSYLGQTTKPIGTARFHAEIDHLSKKHPRLFAGFAFSKHSSDPFSKVLEQMMFVMTNAGLLGVWTDGCWEIRGVAQAFNDLYRKHFTVEELQIIDEEGQTLAAKVARGELVP